MWRRDAFLYFEKEVDFLMTSEEGSILDVTFMKYATLLLLLYEYMYSLINVKTKTRRLLSERVSSVLNSCP